MKHPHRGEVKLEARASKAEAPEAPTDLRPPRDRDKDPFDNTSWIIQVDDGVYLPVCSFSSDSGEIIILFLEGVHLSRPEDSSSDAFWKPWREKARIFMSFAATGEPIMAAMIPAVMWRVKDGQVLPSTLATPMAMARMPRYPGVGSAVLTTIESLLAARKAGAEAQKQFDQIRHRVARFGVPHRPTGRHGVVGHPSSAVGPRRRGGRR